MISAYWMNTSWLNRQKSRANKASYRDYEHGQELPSEYFIRKPDLLQLVYDHTDSEMIFEIMSSAPEYWNRVIDTQRCLTLLEFQNAIKYHEDSLMNSTMSQESSLERRLNVLELSMSENRYWTFNRPDRRNSSQAQTNLVGYSPSLGLPKWPRDDSVVTKSGRMQACRLGHSLFMHVFTY